MRRRIRTDFSADGKAHLETKQQESKRENLSETNPNGPDILSFRFVERF